MSKLRKAAKGKPCYLRLAPYCNHDPETTVAAHIGASGMGMKSHDIMSVYADDSCHAIIDGRMKHNLTEAEIATAKLRALELTLLDRIEEGLITIG